MNMKRITIISLMMLALAALSCVKEKTVAEPLKADFDCDVLSVLVGEEVTFNDKSAGAPSRWNWTFEGAETETSILTQPVVRWMKAGTYSVSLEVSNATETSSVKKDALITVAYHPSVRADFTVDKTQAFDTQTVNFTNTSEGFPETVKWTFTPKVGEAVVSTDYNPSLQFAPGVYTVKLEVSNPLASDEKTVEDLLTVVDQYAVMAHFTSDLTTTYEGGSISFKDASEGNAQSWEWTFEGGEPAASTEQNPVVKYSAGGRYKVRLRTYNDRYESIEEKEGYIKVVPASGLVFMLPFDGDILDYGPNKLKPTAYENAKGGVDLHLTFEEGRDGYGSCVKFPTGSAKGGPYSVIQMPDKLQEIHPDGSDMTVSVWVNHPTTTASYAIFAQGDCPGVASGNSCQIWWRFQTNNQLRCTAEQTTPKVGITSTVSNAGAADGTWHHIAVSFAVRTDGKRYLTVYIDGVQKGTANGANFDVKTLPMFIGCNLRFTNGAWAPENINVGQMDDYLYYNRALSAEEIATLASYR